MEDGKKPWRQCKNKKCGAITDEDEKHCPACSSQEAKIVFLTFEEALGQKVWTKFPTLFYGLLGGQGTSAS